VFWAGRLAAALDAFLAGLSSRLAMKSPCPPLDAGVTEMMRLWDMHAAAATDG